MTQNLATATFILIGAAAAVAMTTLDVDGDAMVSFEELRAAYPELTADQFEAADADADGLLTETELADARAAGLIPDEQG